MPSSNFFYYLNEPILKINLSYYIPDDSFCYLNRNFALGITNNMDVSRFLTYKNSEIPYYVEVYSNDT